MRKTFQLKGLNKNIDRQVDSIKNEVRKYIKREKSKRPPEGFNFWAFDCKFGKTAEEATEIKFVDVTKSIDFAVSEDYDSFYLELIARADVKRVMLTKEYIKNSYGLEVENINITPEIIVIHHTATDDLKESYDRFKPELLLQDRKYISKAGSLNVSAHFLVDFDGTIYSMMPETYMARHVIGLNLSSIGIENVGGNKKALTKEQLEANIKLVEYLKEKYKTINF